MTAAPRRSSAAVIAAAVLLAMLLLAPSMAAPARAAATGTAPAPAAPAPALTVRGHTYAIAAGEPLAIHLTIAGEHVAGAAAMLDTAADGADTDEVPAIDLRVVVHPPVTTLAALDAALDRPDETDGRTARTVAVTPDSVVDGTATESTVDLHVALPLDLEPGVHPIGISLGDTTVRSVIRVTDPDTTPAVITAALLVTVDDPGPFPTAATATAARAAVRRVVELADDFDGPLTVVLPPSAARLVAPGPADAGNDAALAGGLGDDTLLARSANGIDPSAAVHRNAAELFTADLRDGEDQLARRVPLAAIRRNVWWVDGEISRPAAAHLRLVGVRMLLFAPGAAPDGGAHTAPFVVELGDGERMTAIAATGFDGAGRLHLTEHTTTEHTTAGPDVSGELDVPPAIAAARMVAGIELHAGEHQTTALVLTPVEAQVPDPGLLAAVAANAAQHGGIEIDAATAVANVAERATRTTDVDVVTLPDSAGHDLATRLWSIGALRPRIDQARSMLVDPDVGADWDDRITATLSATVPDADAAAALADVEAEVGAILTALIPPEAVPFTLTGTDTPLHFAVTNTSDTPLRAAVRIRSSKLEMRAAPEQRVIPPGGTETFDVPVKARSNGTFAVVVDVLSPDGRPVASTPNIKATVTRLGGLGQVVSGGLVLVLASWWYSHFRRRARNAAAARQVAAAGEAHTTAHDGG